MKPTDTQMFILEFFVIFNSRISSPILNTKQFNMNILYLSFILLISFTSNAQSFSKKKIKNTEWFSDNIDSVFFKRDTIKLIKYTQKSQQQFNKFEFQYDESEYEYLGHLEYVKLGFKKGSNFNFNQINWSQGISYVRGVLFWKYDENNMIISIYENKNLKYSFKISSVREIDIVSKTLDQKIIKSTELTLIKLK